MSYDPIETLEHAGMVIEIHHDDSAESPRENDNLGVMVCNHRRYNLGDVKGNADDIPDDAIVLPIYMYDHSGITINTTGFSCPWDSGQVGAIYCTRENALKEWNAKRLTKKIRQKIVERLQAEVEEYDSFLSGDVYGFVIKDHEGMNLDSCWGFVGDMKYCIDQAKEAAEHAAKSSLSYAI